MANGTSLGDPVPLGLTGFGLTTFMVGLIEANWLTGSGAMDAVIPLAIAYGGTIQLFAGLLAWRNGDTFGLVAFNTYGAFWWWFALVELFSINNILTPSTTAMGVTLIGFGVITSYLFVGSLAHSTGLAAVFATLALAYYGLGIGDWLGLEVLVILGGYLAMLTALIAVAVAFAHVINESVERETISTGRPLIGSESTGTGRSGD